MTGDLGPTPGIDPAAELDAVDVEVLAALREMWGRVDPVPAGLVDDVKFALTVQALQAEVAELQLLSAGEPAGARSVDYSRTESMSFTSGALTAMVTVTSADGHSVRLDGWVSGVELGRVELVQHGHTDEAPVDDGRFVFERLPHGLVQLVFHPVDTHRRPVLTPTVEI